MENDYYRTRILDLGAFLIASDIPLVDVEPAYSGLFFFVFENPQKCIELERSFNAGGLNVDAQKLLAAKSHLIDELQRRKNANK
jgi:hypothetical protein